jgi:predicted dinucleotide-utilizing enzyme
MDEKEKVQAKNSLINYMANPRAFTLKQWLYQLLKEHYPKHEDMADRVSTVLATQKDLEDFGKMLSQVFECGYRKAIEDYAEEAAKKGISVKVVSPYEKGD